MGINDLKDCKIQIRASGGEWQDFGEIKGGSVYHGELYSLVEINEENLSTFSQDIEPIKFTARLSREEKRSIKKMYHIWSIWDEIKYWSKWIIGLR